MYVSKKLITVFRIVDDVLRRYLSNLKLVTMNAMMIHFDGSRHPP